MTILQFLPALAALRKPRMLLVFLALLGINQATQMQVCCRRCIQYSKDPWKRDTCPTYKLARKIYE